MLVVTDSNHSPFIIVLPVLLPYCHWLQQWIHKKKNPPPVDVHPIKPCPNPEDGGATFLLCLSFCSVLPTEAVSSRSNYSFGHVIDLNSRLGTVSEVLPIVTALNGWADFSCISLYNDSERRSVLLVCVCWARHLIPAFSWILPPRSKSIRAADRDETLENHGKKHLFAPRSFYSMCFCVCVCVCVCVRVSREKGDDPLQHSRKIQEASDMNEQIWTNLRHVKHTLQHVLLQKKWNKTIKTIKIIKIIKTIPIKVRGMGEWKQEQKQTLGAKEQGMW